MACFWEEQESGGSPWPHGLEAAVAVPLLILAYSRSSGKQPLRWDSATARTLWNQGRHFLLSGLLVALYGQTDRLMLRSMAGEAAVGLYGAAGSISALWIFVPAALVETARPLLLARFRRDLPAFVRGWPLCMAYSGMAPAWPPW